MPAAHHTVPHDVDDDHNQHDHDHHHVDHDHRVDDDDHERLFGVECSLY
jgi:hypothetical protein